MKLPRLALRFGAVLFTILSFWSVTAHAQFVTEGLEVYYDARDFTILGVDRGSGQPWRDRAGDDNDLNLGGAASFTSVSPTAGNMHTQAGQTGSIVSGTMDVLTGDGGAGSVGINDTTNGLTGITVEALIRKPITSAGDIFTNASGAVQGAPGVPGGRLWSVEEDFGGNATFKWLVRSGGAGETGAWHGTITPGPMPDDQWYHFLGVWGDRDGNGIQTQAYDESLVRMFINGVEIDTTQGPTDRLNVDAVGRPSIQVGHASDLGQMGFTRIYTRALDSAEIQQNWSDAQTFFVPEPSALVLLVVGAVMLLHTQRPRTRKA